MAVRRCFLLTAVLLLRFLASQTSASDSKSSEVTSMTSSDQGAMDMTIQDLFEEPLEEDARFFNYDRGAAFNTSVAFTIPLFSFTLPGAQETAETGLDSNTFGVLAFVALFLLGGLGVAIYTTSQGGNEDGIELPRRFGESDYFKSRLLNHVYDSISGLPEALSLDSCGKLSVCAAHAEPLHYGFLSWPIRFMIPVRTEETEHALTEYEKAALFGVGGTEDCDYEYPCLIHPLDTLLYLKDYFLSSK